MPIPKRNLIPGILILLAMIGLAAPPLWWSQGNQPVITGAAENNKGPANIGQAKHMVAQALTALDTAAPTIATQIRADLATSHPGLLTVPSPKPADWAEKQKAPLLLGQLKAIAHPFYTHLSGASPSHSNWLAAERAANGTNHEGSIFPWTADLSDDINHGMANIGQLKAVFSLDFTTLPPFPGADSDNDGLPDEWELQHFGHLNLNGDGDPDEDGLTNRQEFEANTNPATLDTDGDGIPDGSDGNPVQNDDRDGDGIPNSEDAAPNDRLIRWAPSAGKFAFIPLKPSSELRPEGSPTLQANPHGYSMRPALGEDATLTYHFGWESTSPGRPYNGFYELGDELAQPLSFFVAGTVPLGDPPSNTESHSGILKYKDDEWEVYEGTLYGKNDTGVLTGTDHHSGDVIIRSGTSVKSFRKEAASQAYSIDYLGKSRDGRAYLAETTTGVGVRLRSLNKGGVVANHGNLPGSWEGSYSFASNGWFRIGSKLYTPDAVGKALPEHLAGANAWSVPDNGVALLAAGTLYLPNATGNSFAVPSSVQGPPIVGTTDGGVFLASDHSLWRNGEWLPLETWASEELRSRLTPEKILRIVESNSKGVTLVEFKDREPTSSSTSTYGILIPVDLRDIKDSTNTGDDVTITPWDTATQTNPTDANIAWIEPHKSATDAAPRMPQLVLNIPDLPQNATLDAKLLVVYERPYAGKQADDTVKIPEDGSFQSVANGRWEIFNQYTNIPFFGGDATLTYKINGGAEQTIKFAIGGRNPDDVRCKTYTQGLPASPWYAYAIEKHESEAYNPGYYNQFWERHGNSSPINNGVNYTFTRGDALIVRSPGETGVGGTGLAQVTGAGGNKTVSAPREIFWNWQKNVDAFLVIMAAKIQIAETFMNDPTPRNGPGSMPNGQRPQTTFHTGNNVAVPSRVQGLVTFGDAVNNKQPEDAVAIKAYNGASSHWCSWRGPTVHEWQFNYGQNNYVQEVCNEIEEAQP